MLGSLKGIIFIRTFLLFSIKGLCLKVCLQFVRSLRSFKIQASPQGHFLSF